MKDCFEGEAPSDKVDCAPWGSFVEMGQALHGDLVVVSEGGLSEVRPDTEQGEETAASPEVRAGLPHHRLAPHMEAGQTPGSRPRPLLVPVVAGVRHPVLQSEGGQDPAPLLPRLLCGQDTGHSLYSFPGNLGLPWLLLTLLRIYILGLTVSQVLTLDLALDDTLELPLIWLAGSLLSSLWQQRQEGRVCAVRTRSELEARCRLLREGKIPALKDAFTLADIALGAMF